MDLFQETLKNLLHHIKVGKKMEIISKKNLFLGYASDFNFELDADELVEECLRIGFITKVATDSYKINEDY